MKKLLALLFMSMFMISLVSAFESSIDDYKVVSLDIKTISIYDKAFIGEDTELIKLELKTEHLEAVGLGYQKVAEFEINNLYANVDNIIEDFNFYNIKDGMKPIPIEYDLKYKTTEEYESPVYTTTCSIPKDSGIGDTNTTEECVITETGTETLARNVWKDYIPKTLIKDEKLIIGIYTTTKEGDHIEWIPTLYGQEIEEWASWTSSLNVNLTAYYNFNEVSGDLLDKVGSNNGTNDGADYGETGIVNNSYGFIDTSTDSVSIPNNDDINFGSSDFSISIWVKFNTVSSTATILQKGTEGAGGHRYGIKYSSGGQIEFHIDDNSANYKNILSTATYDDNVWHNILAIRDGNLLKLYIDNVSVTPVDITGYGNLDDVTKSLVLGRRSDDTAEYYNGLIDEIGIWKRVLTTDEIGQLYNNGNGITYTNDFFTFPTITLNSPADAETFTIQSIDFNVTVTDSQKVENVTLYIDGVVNETNTSNVNGTYIFSKTIIDGSHNWSIVAWNNQSKNETSVTRTFTVDTSPFIEFISPTPANASNWSKNYIPMKVNVSPIPNRAYCYQEQIDVSSVGDGDCSQVYNQTYISIGLWIAGSNTVDGDFATQGNGGSFGAEMQLNYTIPSGASNLGTLWRVKDGGSDINITLPSDCVSGNLQLKFKSKDTGFINTVDWFCMNKTSSSWINLRGITSSSSVYEEGIYWNVTATTGLINFQNITYDLVNDNGTAFQKFYTTEVYDINFTDLPTGDYTYNTTLCVTTNACNTTETRSIILDVDAPIITFQSPQSMFDYLLIDSEVNLNFTATDTHLDQCWYNYNGTNVSSVCSSGVQFNTTFLQKQNNYNVTVYANDTLGNLNSNTTSWEFKLLVNSHTYNNNTIEGALETFIMNTTLRTGMDLTSATMNYNGTELTPTIASSGQQRILTISNYQIPDYTNDTNVTFYWTFTLADATVINSSDYIQEVNSIKTDNCTAYSYPLLNLSLFDEEYKTALNGTVEIYYEVQNIPDYSTVFNLSTQLSGINTTTLCSSVNLSTGGFGYSVEVRYYATDYATELYHIQKTPITGDYVDLALYDLKLNDSTEFLIEYQDENLLNVKGAIVQLLRRYIPENIYEVVEAPITGNDGTAIVHVDLDTNKYKAIVVKDGEILNTFNDIVFHCENELSGICNQNLFADLNPLNELTLENTNDFSYSISELGNQTLEIMFSIPSGLPSEVTILLSQQDLFGNTTLCNKTVTSSGGSIEATFNRTIGESYLDLTILKDNELITNKQYVIFEDTDLGFAGNNLIIVFLLLISIVGMALSSPEWIIINGVVTMALVGLIWLVKGISIVEGLGSLGYLIVIALILIMKIAKTEDQ